MNILYESIKVIEDWITNLGNILPIEIFSAVGALIEEIIAPIPSPLVMTLSGSILETQNKGVLYLLFIGIIGSVFKTIAQCGFYIIADKTEDIASSKLKIFGLSHKNIENIGKYFKGGYKDELIIIATRALPILPSAVVSVVAGFIKIDFKKYTRASFVGNYFRSLFFLFFGYYGLASYDALNEGFSSFEDILRLVFIVLLAIILIIVLIKRKKYQQELKDKEDV